MHSTTVEYIIIGIIFFIVVASIMVAVDLLSKRLRLRARMLRSKQSPANDR